MAPADVAALRDNGALYIDKKAVRGWGEVTAGYEWFISNGVEGLRKKILARKSELDATVPGDYEKEIYLDALLIVCEGIETLAERYAIIVATVGDSFFLAVFLALFIYRSIVRNVVDPIKRLNN